mmetsp:Transcript_12908/g.16044  ORF Transcript_12908/g.16044 Transcript_12908/m.16044 type:complete len:124 (-) Transcript_12908:1171-1542(-)
MQTDSQGLTRSGLQYGIAPTPTDEVPKVKTISITSTNMSEECWKDASEVFADDMRPEISATEVGLGVSTTRRRLSIVQGTEVGSYPQMSKQETTRNGSNQQADHVEQNSNNADLKISTGDNLS